MVSSKRCSEIGDTLIIDVLTTKNRLASEQLLLEGVCAILAHPPAPISSNVSDKLVKVVLIESDSAIRAAPAAVKRFSHNIRECNEELIANINANSDKPASPKRFVPNQRVVRVLLFESPFAIQAAPVAVNLLF